MLKLDRRTLAQFLPNEQSIRMFEQLFQSVSSTPATIEEANALAGQALAVAQAALSMFAVVSEALAQLEGAPASVPQVDHDDTTPRSHLGTISAQDADQVEITGGTAALSTISLSGQLTSTVADGTAPLVITSTTRVANLNVARAGTADNLGVASAYPANANDLPTAITLVNALKAANTAKGV
jgi:hypothetical protein